MGLMSHFPPAAACNEPSRLPLSSPRSRYKAGQHGWLRGGQGREGKNGGWYLHVPPLWVGVKSDSTVSNSFPPRAARARRERARLTDDSQHLCYAAVTDEGLHIAIALFLSVYGTLPLSSHYSYYNRETDRPSMEITLKWPITIFLFKV